jgi:hypothetical protein
MKAERRHELHENVLAHELSRLREFFDKHGNWITAVIVAAAIVVLVVWYVRGRNQRLLAEEQVSFNEALSSPSLETKDRVSRLEQLANDARDPLVGAESAVFLGDIFADQCLKAIVRGSDEQAAELRARSASFYKLALDKYPKQRVTAARAHFGLASLAETVGDMVTAKAEYALAEQAAGPNYPVTAEARMELENLPLATQPVRFATTTQATTAPAR